MSAASSELHSLGVSSETGARARTRQAILDAAVVTWAKNPGAALGDIAAAARVGRTTLHRYFPERADLTAALARHAEEAVNAATVRARLQDGDAADAVARLAAEYFELGDLLSVLFFAPGVYKDDQSCDAADVAAEDCEPGGVDPPLAAAVARGHRDGSIDAQMGALWVQNLLWSTLYTAQSLTRDAGLSRFDARELIVRTLRKAVGV